MAEVSSSNSPAVMSDLERIFLKSYGSSSLVQAVQDAKVLVVGAGGVGCELLKNLVTAGFHNIEVIDLDTIEVSNLNRQFLFRREHVGRSKAQVAREAVLRFNPKVNIVAHHGNIKDEAFGHEYFEQFTLVMNALDNLEARVHVNRLCLATNVPLIESGTQGYSGQVTVIKPYETECFECVQQPTPKTFAVCTIRSTPDRPIHCIVWAKMLYSLIFGPEDKDSMMVDERAATVLSDDPEESAHRLFSKFFDADIRASAAIKERWLNRAPPTPISLESVLAAQTSEVTAESQAARGVRVLSVEENKIVFLNTIRRIMDERADDVGELEFDKDDRLAMDFVSAAANLRMANFGIERQSFFHAKGIAGNIVHAIGTTNAMAAGLIVKEALKLLSGQDKECKTTWIGKTLPQTLVPQALVPANKDCYICGKKPVLLRCDVNTFTLRRLFDSVLIKALGFNEPSIDVVVSNNAIGSKEDNGDDYLNLPLSSPSVRINDRELLVVEDITQELKLNLTVQHQVLDPTEYPSGFVVSGAAPSDAPASDVNGTEQSTTSVVSNGKAEAKSDAAADNDVDMAVPAPNTELRASKRQRAPAQNVQSATVGVSKDSAIALDDDDDDDIKTDGVAATGASSGSAAERRAKRARAVDSGAAVKAPGAASSSSSQAQDPSGPAAMVIELD